LKSEFYFKILDDGANFVSSIRKMKEKLLAQRKHLDEVESQLNQMEQDAQARAQSTVSA
jgi:hypothetical protein